MWVGYAASALIVLLGLGIALAAGASVLGVWVGIVMLLFPAFLVPFALRWYWARFNGAGFTVGVGSGFAAAVALRLHPPAGWNEAQLFLAVAGLSLVGAVGVTFLTPGTPMETLRRFHDRVGPFGWWPREWSRAGRREHAADGVRLAAALAWQVLTFMLPMALVLGRFAAATALLLPWSLLLLYLIREIRRASAPEPSL